MKSDRPKLLRAYGDRAGDGLVQLSFTLELPPSPMAKEAARRFAEAHGLAEVLVTCMEQCGPEHSYFVVYGQSRHVVDASRIELTEAEIPDLDKPQIEQRAAEALRRKIVVVGACTGSDAHTVGIDAILNMKGYAGEKGLEAYKAFEVHNLGAQVENEALIARAKAVGADALLVSQVITQRGCHKHNARALVERLEAQGDRDRFLLLLGGPRIDHKLALSLGFDAGFGPGSLPRHVAAFIVQRMIEVQARAGADGGNKRGLKCSA
jgi:beta-lysine 5,6-aminomutase beta subunit